MYVKSNYSKFYGFGGSLMFFIAIMKLSGGLFCEIVNILTIVQSETIGDVIKDFIAFGIIAEIDDIIVSTITTIIDIGSEINDNPITFPAS